MNIDATLITAFLAGFATCAAPFALHLAHRIKALRTQCAAEQQTRIAVLDEQLRALRDELDTCRRTLDESNAERDTLRTRLIAAGQDIARLREQAARLPEIDALRKANDAMRAQERQLGAQVASLQTELDAERAHGREKLALLGEAREELANQFKTLANEIFDDKSRRFTEQNQTTMKQLLDPMRTKLVEFQAQVEKAYVQEGKDRAELTSQVRQLMDLNRQLSDDANNLTRALKGNSKTRGDWGELILERILESSGLRKGEEFTVQESHTTDGGRRLQPDVVIHLPQGKHLVIDSKVSLNAYLEHTRAEADDEREHALKGHIAAMRTHIRELSAKDYQALYGMTSPDFVIMFVPVEPAYLLAISKDATLWREAWDRNILLVSPSTLLFVVRTVATLWRQEQQTRNAQEIAQRGALLYDKFKGFVDDIDDMGTRLDQARRAYDKARGKLCTGTGNLIRQAEMLRELGVKPKSPLPHQLVESAMLTQD
ncbi:DNA recombination protein RmuC [Desulfobaculum xiamenense]|uniref:DNA recombination protein RmuC n=1 Tax=Desulfobaculum xiamenense TaxID=995050 RepID=A0A846QJK4_9BACT|nr:DNA recombination protein RmuC [Desulfobaculum xiamenense]NJB66363.1 DNA recombination protein RmuC [Desulfobaculum xiamenense]